MCDYDCNPNSIYDSIYMPMITSSAKAKYFSKWKWKNLNPVQLFFILILAPSQNKTSMIKSEPIKKFNININIIKDIINFYETETNNYNKKLSRYKNFINVADITEKLLSSIATTMASTSDALSSIGLLYSIPAAFVTATVCGSVSKTISNRKKNKIVKYSQKYILSKQFNDKFNKLYTKSMNDSKIDNDEYNENYLRYMKNIRRTRRIN